MVEYRDINAGGDGAITGNLNIGNKQEVALGWGDLYVTGDLTVDGSISGGLWTANGSDIYYNDGNVGIGTTSPGADLTISHTGKSYIGSSSVGMILHRSDASSNAYASTLALSAYENKGGGISAGGEGFKIFTSDGSTASIRMAIDTSGNIGIGTTTPNALLSVFADETHSKEKISLWGASKAHMLGTEAYHMTIGPGAEYGSSVGTKFYSRDGELAAQIGFGGSGSPSNRQDSYFAGSVGIA